MTADALAARAEDLDRSDALAGFADRFGLGPGTVYLEANSLGAPQRHIADRLAAAVREQWGGDLIGAWRKGWWRTPEQVGDRIAAVIGAGPGQVVATESTSTNLFNATVGAARADDGRSEIIVDAGTFPTNRYVAESAARLTGCRLRPVDAGDMPEAVSVDTAVVLVDHSNFRTAQLADLPAIAAAAHEVGAWCVADLSHSAGVLPTRVADAGVDIAVGCTYKYLSGGPGAPGLFYLRPDRLTAFDPALTGWNGHRDPFAMSETYEPAGDISRVRCGTPPILSLLALDAALDIWDDVGIEDVRAKSLSLSGFFVDCVDELLGETVQVLTPRDTRRGGHVAVACDDADAALDALAAAGVIADVRPPNLLRLGFGPLWTSHRQALLAAEALATAVARS